jgi:hypothetical protein
MRHSYTELIWSDPKPKAPVSDGTPETTVEGVRVWSDPKATVSEGTQYTLVDGFYRD